MHDDVDRHTSLLSHLEIGPPQSLLHRLCALAVREIHADGAILGLQVDGLPDGPIAASSPWALEVAAAEYALGEGPTFEVAATNEHVEFSAIGPQESQRWPQFARLARGMNVAAIFGFPLNVGAARLGMLSLLRVSPTELDDEEYLNCLALGDIVANALIYVNAGLGDAPFEHLARVRDLDRVRVHQATGMVAGQLDCSIEDALARLRARAFLEDLSLYEVASRVLGGAIRFDNS